MTADSASAAAVCLDGLTYTDTDESLAHLRSGMYGFIVQVTKCVLILGLISEQKAVTVRQPRFSHSRVRALACIMNMTANYSGMKMLADARLNSRTPEIGLLVACGNVEAVDLHFIEEIHVRAETITSVLQEFLDFHPANHWDVN